MKTFIIRVFYRIGFSVEQIEASTFSGACNDLFVTLPWVKAEKIIGFENCQTREQKAFREDCFNRAKLSGTII